MHLRSNLLGVCSWLIFALAIALVWPAPCAQAQSRRRAASAPTASAGSEGTSVGAPPGYDAAIENALHEFELQNYAEARSGFREAHRLYPNARTFRALGMVEFELKNYGTALEYLTQALSNTERPLSDTQRVDAEKLLSRARGYVGRYRVSIRPPQATLILDGARTAPDREGAVVLSVGEHVLEAEAEGHRPLRHELHVVGGEDETLDLALLPLVATSTRESKPDAQPAQATPVYKKWWLWTTIGVVVAAGVATGLVFGLREDKSEPGGSTNTVLRLPPESSAVRF